MKITKKGKLIDKIFSERNKDYTFSILFFLIFSIFIFYAIRPSLSTAFALRKEESDLLKVNEVYERRIVDIARLQSQIEDSRDNLYLIEQSIPRFPQVSKVIDDINTIDQKGNFSINKAYLGEVDLSQNAEKQTLKKMKVTVDAEGDFDGTLNFINALINQRRLKNIQKISIQNDNESTTSSQLKINMELINYHL